MILITTLIERANKVISNINTLFNCSPDYQVFGELDKLDLQELVELDRQIESELTSIFRENLISEDEYNEAKLSTGKRNRLPSGSFCGPKRSFPCHDCAHVRAAARLVNRYKGSKEVKAKILACIKRKNKSMGCGVKIQAQPSNNK